MGGFFPPLYGESSPFYVASPLACRCARLHTLAPLPPRRVANCNASVPRRIANTLPGARLVVLLREPVARAYSEWQVSEPSSRSANDSRSYF